MIYKFTDRDIDEIFTGCIGWSNILFINYTGPTESTYYTREDLLHMIDIIDGVEEGVKVL